MYKRQLIACFMVCALIAGLLTGCKPSAPGQGSSAAGSSKGTAESGSGAPADSGSSPDGSSSSLLDDYNSSGGKGAQGSSNSSKTGSSAALVRNFAKKYSKTFLNFLSPDLGFDNFINDFMKRHLRYDGNRIGEVTLGNSVMFNKEWEAMSLMWFDSTSQNLSEDRYVMMKYWLENIPIDKFGYVWSNYDELQPNISTTNTYFGQGWPFPEYDLSYGNSAGWEFNAGTGNWTVKAGNTTVTPSISDGLLLSAAQNVSSLEMISPQIQVNWFYAPILEVDIRLLDLNNSGLSSDIDDIYVYWKTKGDTDWSERKSVSQKSGSTAPKSEIPARFLKKLYFPLYLSSEYKGKDITQIKIVVKAKSGKTLNLQSNLNYVRMNFDTRRADNNALLINSAKYYYEYTQDKAFLTKILPKLRRAMQFYIGALGGAGGLISTDFFIGHDGATGVGHGISSSYWDIIAFPEVDLSSNIEFYKALQSMAYLERMAAATGVSAPNPTVADKTGSQTVAYAQTAASLTALAAKAKEQIRTKFWDKGKGRFFSGYLAGGAKMDYGYITFNLYAVTSGIATADQARQIMDWVTGKRTIGSDTSTGEDIYKYEFAPRTSTVKNDTQYSWNWYGAGVPFGSQMQDGGAALFISYFDIMSRIQVYGADNAYARFKEIQKWYEKVASYEGEGERFYREYYEDPDIIDELGTTLQGNGSAGGLGIDAEFVETALLYSAVPLGFFGISSADSNTLSISPNLPSQLSTWKLENLMFGKVRYDVTAGKNSVQLSAVSSAGKATVEVRLKTSKSKVTVKYNGANYTDYTLKNGVVTVKIPLKNGKVEMN